MKNRYKALISDTILIGIGNFTTKLIYFFLMPIYTISMTAAEFGQADLLNNMAALLLPILTLSINEGVFRYVLDNDENPNELLTIGFGIVALCTLLSTVIFFVVCCIAYEKCWLPFYLYFISEALRGLLAQFSRGVGYVKEFSISGVVGAFVLILATYVMVKEYELGVLGYFYAFVVANTCSIIYLVAKVNPIRTFVWSYSTRKGKELLVYSLPLVPNTLSWWVTNVSSRYVIAYQCGIALAGLYAATSKLPALINVVTSIFQQSWQISSVKQLKAMDYLHFYSKVFVFYSSVIFVFGSLIILLVPFISKLVLQGEFYHAWVYTPLLLFSSVLGSFSVYFGTFYTVAKKSKSVMATTLIGAFTNILLCIFLVPLFGIYGALVANVLCFVIVVCIRYYDTQKFMPIMIQRRKLLASFVLLLLESIVMTMDMEFSLCFSLLLVFFLFFLNITPIAKSVIAYCNEKK